MSEDLVFYSSNFADWNYNKMINLKDIDPFDSNQKLNTCNYKLYKYNCLICYINIIV
jgi:hypothetical protein